MAQERLLGLAILSIIAKADLKRVVWDFAHRYAKRSKHVHSYASQQETMLSCEHVFTIHNLLISSIK